MTGRFRKKPVVIDAYAFAGRLGATFPEWLATAIDAGDVYFYRDEMIIRTREGAMIANPGDWIIKGVAGELYPCKPEIFTQTYEAVA